MALNCAFGDMKGEVITIASKNDARINEQIHAENVMVIAPDGEKIGVMGFNEALEIAYERDMDLVEMSANSEPPVCRIMDYGKYLYERKKKDKENKKNSKNKPIKEMKFRCNIGDGDYETKKRHIVRFIEDGSPVRITIMFRGREMTHPEIGMEILDRLTQDLEGLVNVQAAPKMEGRNMTMTVVPVRK